MFHTLKVAVVVPAYNERERIQHTLRSIPGYVDRVIVVDDGSRDGTAELARSVGDARVSVVQHAVNRGVGAALATGYEHAFAAGPFGVDVAAVMAGDGQMHPADLSALLVPFVSGQVDYVKGDRLSHPDAFARMPLARYLGNRMLSWLTRLATGLPLSDSQCGFTALHRRAHSPLAQYALWPGYGYPNDLIGLCARENLRVHDVTVRPIYAGEASGIRLHHALLVIPFLLARVLARRIGRALKTPREAGTLSPGYSASERAVAADAE